MKLLKYMSWLLIAMTMSIGLAACSSDDDDDDVSGGKSELVGRWESWGGDWGYKLDANGKGYGFEIYHGELDRWNIEWTYRNNHLIITDREYDKYGEIYNITYLDGDMMAFETEDDEGELYRVDKFDWE